MIGLLKLWKIEKYRALNDYQNNNQFIVGVQQYCMITLTHRWHQMWKFYFCSTFYDQNLNLHT